MGTGTGTHKDVALARTPRSWLAAITAALLLLVAVGPVAGQEDRGQQDRGGPGRYLVPVDAPLPFAAQVLERLPVAGALLISSPTVPPRGVPADTPVGWRTLLPEDDNGMRLDSGVASTRADQAWEVTNGAGAVVALLDTGVAPVPALEGAIAGEIDFSGTGGGDGYGHGTFMASLIAGRDPGGAMGVAPGALVLSLKVAGPDGTSNLGTVLAAMQWLYGPGSAAGLHIAVLALGVDADSDAAQFLDQAADTLSQRGMLLVTAVGNEGPGNLSSPATSTGTFSVGAVDDQSDADRTNDTTATFSASGPDRAGVPQPDVAASGVNVVGVLPPDSMIASSYPPEAIIDGQYYRGTGTSMSTALTAGVAALAAAARPDLDGAALDTAMRAGSGELDAVDTLTAAQAAPAPNHGNEARGHGQAAQPPAHSREAPGLNPSSVRDAAVRWGAVRWGAVRWGAVRWGAVRWGAVRWGGDHWGDENWDAGSWGGVRWGAAGWAGEEWTGDAFGAVRWAGVRWALIPETDA